METISQYGTIICTPLFKDEIFEGIDIPSDSYVNKMTDLCLSIMRGKCKYINKLIIEEYTRKIISNNHIDMLNVLVDVFNTVTKEFSDWTQNMADIKELKLRSFLEYYQKIYNNTRTLRDALWYCDNHLIVKGDKPKFNSGISLIKDVSIFINVINTDYKFNDKRQKIYEFVGNHVNNNSANIDDVLSFYKIYQYHNRLVRRSTLPKEIKDLMISDNKFTLTNGMSGNQILTQILNNANEIIKQISTEKSKDKVEQLNDQVRDVLHMGQSIGERAYFMLLYKSMLTDRLLKNTSDPKIEHELMKMFMSYKEDPDMYAKIRFQIFDAISSKYHCKIFNDLEVNAESEKFKNYDMSKLNREHCNFTIARQYAWDIIDQDNFDAPIDVNVYLAIFNAYYSRQYSDYALSIAHNYSTGKLKMKLADMEEYTILMTLPQMYIILLLAKNGEMTARNIGKELGIALNRLSSVFNSLIDCELIIRSQGDPKNPDVPFSINWNKSYPSKKMSIIESLKKIQQAKENMKTNNDIVKNTQTENISPILIRAKMFSILMTHKKLMLDELKTKLIEELKDITEEIFQRELKFCLTNNSIVKEGDKFMCKDKKNDIIDDSDDDKIDEIKNTVDKIIKEPLDHKVEDKKMIKVLPKSGKYNYKKNDSDEEEMPAKKVLKVMNKIDSDDKKPNKGAEIIKKYNWGDEEPLKDTTTIIKYDSDEEKPKKKAQSTIKKYDSDEEEEVMNKSYDTLKDIYKPEVKKIENKSFNKVEKKSYEKAEKKSSSKVEKKSYGKAEKKSSSKKKSYEKVVKKYQPKY